MFAGLVSLAAVVGTAELPSSAPLAHLRVFGPAGACFLLLLFAATLCSFALMLHVCYCCVSHVSSRGHPCLHAHPIEVYRMLASCDPVRARAKCAWMSAGSARSAFVIYDDVILNKWLVDSIRNSDKEKK